MKLNIAPDCIRTYTWDKKLESWIKDRGKNKPTITSPKDYRTRFRIAMEKYILQAPNCWHQFQGRVVGVGIEKNPGVGMMSGIGTGHTGGGSIGSALAATGLDAAEPNRRRITLEPGHGGEKRVMEVEGGEQEKAEGSRI